MYIKSKTIVMTLLIFSAVSCNNKIDLSTEKFDKTKFKETIEKAYADSTNKENKDILLSYINANLEDKLHSAYALFKIKDRLIVEESNLTYGDILNKYAKPLEEFKKKANSIIDIKLIKFTYLSDSLIYGADLEIQNKGEVDIVEVKFDLNILNKSGEQLYLPYQPIQIDQTLPKGSTTKVKIRDNEFEKFFKMDSNSLTKTFAISKLSFQDGTTLKLPIIEN